MYFLIVSRCYGFSHYFLIGCDGGEHGHSSWVTLKGKMRSKYMIETTFVETVMLSDIPHPLRLLFSFLELYDYITDFFFL